MPIKLITWIDIFKDILDRYLTKEERDNLIRDNSIKKLNLKLKIIQQRKLHAQMFSLINSTQRLGNNIKTITKSTRKQKRNEHLLTLFYESQHHPDYRVITRKLHAIIRHEHEHMQKQQNMSNLNPPCKVGSIFF